MLKSFQNFISEKKLANKNDKILLAVSGGADSVVMLNLFSLSNFRIAIAHCNFLLRGLNSDKDQKFVSDLAKKYKIQLFSKTCNAKLYAKKNKISIEMAARELRYNWFFELASKHKFTKIATAHHQNDSVETILLNLSKKTGIKGLTGIPAINNNIIRPLLFANKRQILNYCTTNNLKYRTDQSNFDNNYQRNKIRNNIIPEFEKISPSFVDNVAQTAKYLQQYVDFFKSKFKKFKNLCVYYNDFSIHINTKKIIEFEPLNLFMFEFLKEYGFNSSQVNNIISSLNSVGKQFYAEQNRIIINRNELIITNLQSENKKKNYFINYNDQNITINNKQVDALILKIKILNRNETEISKNKNIAMFDFDKLKFPLKIRKWKAGDFFIPLGMHNKKKLSNFFADNKFSLIDKENTWLLTSDDEIVWIISHRIDNRYKITENTQKIIVFEKI